MKRILFSLLFLTCNYTFAQVKEDVSKDVMFLLKTYLFQITFNDSSKSETLFNQFQNCNLDLKEIGAIPNYDIVFYKIDLSKEQRTDGLIKSKFHGNELILAVESEQVVYLVNGGNNNLDLLKLLSIFHHEMNFRDNDFQKLHVIRYNLKKLFKLFKRLQRLKKKNDLLYTTHPDIKIVTVSCF